MSFWSRLVDERFLEHRRQSTSTAGVIAVCLALCLFAYHLYVDHVYNWDLLAVGVTMVGVKLFLITWYTLRD